MPFERRFLALVAPGRFSCYFTRTMNWLGVEPGLFRSQATAIASPSHWLMLTNGMAVRIVTIGPWVVMWS